MLASVPAVRGLIHLRAGCGGTGAVSEAVPVDINVCPCCVYLNSIKLGAVPLVLPDRLGELEVAEQIILGIDEES